MSKPISFGFGKSKGAVAVNQKVSAPARVSNSATSKPTRNLHNDSDNEDEEEPKHESVTGFSSNGAILSKPTQEKLERIIQNPGNRDWRRRNHGKNLLPEEVQAARNQDVVMIERDEVSKASGLQFANPQENGQSTSNGYIQAANAEQEERPQKALTEDEIALQALLDDGTGKPKSNAVIAQQGNDQFSARDEVDDFRADVASRPDSSTLEDYAAMPVEEFGMAMLRGMGLKRRANGEAIDLNGNKADDRSKKARKQEGFLGIGAKPVPGSDIELGAWGKAEMRKNNRGEGFFTPLMRENKTTGERISEEELQKRIKSAKEQKTDEDWRERRDRNLERSGRDRDRGRDRDTREEDGKRKAITNGDGYRDQMNEFSSRHSSTRRERDDRDYDSSRSRRERSRSRDRRKKDDYDDDEYDRRRREKHRDKYRENDRYDSSSSRRSGHHGRDRDRDKDDDRRHRDRR